MAIPDGKPATDFSAMNREWVRAVAAESGGGIPAPENPSNGDVLTYDSTDSAWVAAAPGGGGGSLCVICNEDGELNKNYAEIKAVVLAGQVVSVAYINEEEGWIAFYTVESIGYENSKYYVNTVRPDTTDQYIYTADTETGTLTYHSGE